MDSPRSFSAFEMLPGEIRNQIFELCIAEAMKNSEKRNQRTHQYGTRYGTRRQRLLFGSPRFFPPPTTDIKVSVLPGWSGPAKIKTLGIGPCPLLFVNKQINSEVSSLIDSKVTEVSIGPYGIQYDNEDPNIRWNRVYDLLQNRPHLLKHAKNVKVYLPWLRHDLLQNYWMNMGHKWEYKNKKCFGVMVVPSLAKFLTVFESLSKLEVVLVAEIRTPPNMEPLLELYDLCEKSTIVEIVEPHFQGDTLRIATPPLSGWVKAWQSCLLEHRGVTLEESKSRKS